jgi:hypothetical protein
MLALMRYIRLAIDEDSRRRQRIANDLAEQDQRPPVKASSTTDAEASSALESVAEDAAYENLPASAKQNFRRNG